MWAAHPVPATALPQRGGHGLAPHAVAHAALSCAGTGYPSGAFTYTLAQGDAVQNVTSAAQRCITEFTPGQGSPGSSLPPVCTYSLPVQGTVAGHTAPPAIQAPHAAASGYSQIPTPAANAPSSSYAGDGSLPGSQMPYWPMPRGVSGGQAACSSVPALFKVGDQVEIWSNSQHSWCRGMVDRMDNGLVSVMYTAADGHQICKVMNNGESEGIRLVVGGGKSCSQATYPGSGSRGTQPGSEADVAQQLRKFRSHGDNQQCADCGAAHPEWASLQEGTLVCLDCAGVHRCMSMSMKSLARVEFWQASEASSFCAMGGNITANRRLAELAGLAAPRPPPDTDRNFVERYIVRKYGGTTFVDSYQCEEASRALVRELADEVERRRLAKEKADHEAAERARREQAERERKAREAQEAAERVRQEQAREAAERLRRERAAALAHQEQVQAAARADHAARARSANAAVAAVAAEAAVRLSPGSFRDASPIGRAIPWKPLGNPMVQDAPAAVSGLVVVDVVAVNLFKERARDLRYVGAWSLNLTAVVSLGKLSSVATPPRKGSASVRWEPPEQRELRWDCKQRWLWCRVNDNLGGGHTQLAGVGVLDVRAAEAEAIEDGSGVAEMELELLAREPAPQAGLADFISLNACQAKPAIDEDDDPDESLQSRKANAACWQVPAGRHGPPGPPGAHGHYMFEQVEDIDHLNHGQTCGTAILRLTVLDPGAKTGAPRYA